MLITVHKFIINYSVILNSCDIIGENIVFLRKYKKSLNLPPSKQINDR